MVITLPLRGSTSGQNRVFKRAVILRTDLPNYHLVDCGNYPQLTLQLWVIVHNPTFTFPTPSLGKKYLKSFSPGIMYYLTH